MPYQQSNVLLDAMPEGDRLRLLRHLKPVTLPTKAILYEPEEQPKYVHYLTSGIASIVTTMKDGDTTEVGTVGREGSPEGVHLLGPLSVSTRCFVQIAGTALRIEYRVLKALFQDDEAIRRPLLAYAQYQNVILGQIGSCNRLHPVEPRLARWLLMVQDRTGDTVLRLTQEFLGQMMGSQRTTVSAVAGALQARGLIEYVRGSVRVLDRKGLEKAACECYCITQNLLGCLYGLAGQTLLIG